MPACSSGTPGRPHRASATLYPMLRSRIYDEHYQDVSQWSEVTIVRRVQPPSQPPPAGGRSRVPAPSGEGQGGGQRRARGAVARAGRPRSQGMCIAALCGAAAWTANVTMGEPGSPIPPPAGGRGPQAGGWGNRVSPSPPPPGGRGWEQYFSTKVTAPSPALPRWGRESGAFPQRGEVGRGAERGEQHLRTMSNVNMEPGTLTWWEGLGDFALKRGNGETGFPHSPHPREGVRGRRPPRKTLLWSLRH